MPTFIVDNTPISQPRHQIAGNGGRYIRGDHPIHVYKQLVRMGYGGRHPLEGPVSTTIDFYMPRPKGIDKQLPTHSCYAPNTREDIDNLLKAVFDALNSHAYRDDKQICEVHARKLFVPRGGEPKTIITIEPGGSL